MNSSILVTNYETDDEVVSDIIVNITFGGIKELLNLSISSKQWNSRCSSDQLWILYLKDTTPAVFNTILLNLSLVTGKYALDLFSLLWTRTYGPFVKERRILGECLLNSYKPGNEILINLLENLGAYHQYSYQRVSLRIRYVGQSRYRKWCF
jgi:hypothetical protein